MLVGYFLAFLGILYGQSGYFIRSETNGFLASGGAALVSFGLKRTGRFGDRSSTKALINGSLAGLVRFSWVFCLISMLLCLHLSIALNLFTWDLLFW